MRGQKEYNEWSLETKLDDHPVHPFHYIITEIWYEEVNTLICQNSSLDLQTMVSGSFKKIDSHFDFEE